MSNDIKVVIELDKDLYEGIAGKNDCEVEPRVIVRDFQATIADAIANGTPITEGDAISRSELQERREADNDLIKAFELLKAHCKNRECNKDCIFFRELAIGENKDQYCALCEIVTSDDKENEE